jgi:hypothetical protein
MMKKSNKFKLYRDKTRIGVYDQITAHKMARTDALREVSEHRNPTYVIVGRFDCDEQTRIGKLKRGRIYWKFVKPN